MPSTAGRMAENSKVKRKSGRRNPAGLLSFMSLSGKESSKETFLKLDSNQLSCLSNSFMTSSASVIISSISVFESIALL